MRKNDYMNITTPEVGRYFASGSVGEFASGNKGDDGVTCFYIAGWECPCLGLLYPNKCKVWQIWK